MHRAATPDAQALLKWFKELPTRDAKRVVSGQQIDDITAASYEQFIGKLATRTGTHPAMVGVMVRDAWSRADSKIPSSSCVCRSTRSIRHRGVGLETPAYHPSE